jgi:hypothetical protein
MTLAPKVVASLSTDDLTGVVLGPDGAAYVLDQTAATVYRINLDNGSKIPVLRVGAEPQVGGSIVGNPRLLATGGPDVLILDDFNSVWRWRPADNTGRGKLLKWNVQANTTWGTGTRALGTFVTNQFLGQYNLYVVVPNAQQIMKYQPAVDGSMYPSEGGTPYLKVSQDVTKVDDMYVDGNIFLVDNGKIVRYQAGQAATNWSVDVPPDTADKVLRPKAPFYKSLTADNPAQDQGTFYAYDSANNRVVAIKKSDGTVSAQFIVPPTMNWFSHLTGMFVVPGIGTAAPTLYWTEGSNLMSAYLGTDSGTRAPSATAGTTSPTASTPASPVVSPSAH